MSEMPSPVNFTDAAASKVSALIAEEGNDQLKLRVFITGGGCSGFQYIWGLSSEIDEEYTEIDNILLLDRMAEMYVLGSEIDYVTELGGSFLRVVNPTAKNSCGCGESFSV